MKSTITAIDFGTSKIVTLIADTRGAQSCDIVGAGLAQYAGYEDGVWLDPEKLNDAIEKSVRSAVEQSNRKVTDVNIGVPGAFTRVYSVEVSLTIQGPNPRVTPQHVEKLLEKADHQLSPKRGKVVHRSPAWFMVDGGKKTLEPVDCKGSEFKAMVSIVVADQFFLEDLQARFTSLGYNVTGFFSSCTGEAMLYIPEKERDRTAVLVDVGYLCTDVMTVEGDAIIAQETLPIGGYHIASDVSQGLDISMEAAEEIKRKYVYDISALKQEDSMLNGYVTGTSTFTQAEVAEVLEPRVDELAEMINQSLENSGIKLAEWSNIYLTGGGISFNRGGKDYLSTRLHKTVREVERHTSKLHTPIYSSAMGLIDLVIDTVQSGAVSGGAIKDFFSNLFGW